MCPAFPRIREAAERRWRPPVLAVGLVASAVAPYLVCTLPTGTFHWGAVILLAAVAATACFWFLLLPRNGFSDAGFILLMAAVKLFGLFAFIYPTVAPKVPLEILGFLMWIRLGVMVVLSFRRAEGIGFGFIPTRNDWLTGTREFFLFLPIGLPLALAIGFVRYRPMPIDWWLWPGAALGTFLGMLWVVALAEEFLFRGLLQQWLSLWLRSGHAGCVNRSHRLRIGALALRAIPELEVRAGGRHRRVVLREGVFEIGGDPSRDGGACADEHLHPDVVRPRLAGRVDLRTCKDAHYVQILELRQAPAVQDCRHWLNVVETTEVRRARGS